MTQPELIPADRHAWDQLELAIAEHDDRSAPYTDPFCFRVQCPRCHSLIARQVPTEERVELGSVNIYTVTDCGKCGYLADRWYDNRNPSDAARPVVEGDFEARIID